MGHFPNSSRFPDNTPCCPVSGQAGVQLLESEKIKKKDNWEGQGARRLRVQALILVFSLVFPFCTPRLFPPGFSGWFEISGPQGRGKGKFYFREGEFLRIEFMGCSLNFRKGKAVIFDRRRKEYWKGELKELKERFYYFPSLEEIERLWRGESINGFKVVSQDKQGRARIIEVEKESTVIRILRINHGASIDFPSNYRKVSSVRICSRLVPAQK